MADRIDQFLNSEKVSKEVMNQILTIRNADPARKVAELIKNTPWMVSSPTDKFIWRLIKHFEDFFFDIKIPIDSLLVHLANK